MRGSRDIDEKILIPHIHTITIWFVIPVETQGK